MAKCRYKLCHNQVRGERKYCCTSHRLLDYSFLYLPNGKKIKTKKGFSTK